MEASEEDRMVSVTCPPDVTQSEDRLESPRSVGISFHGSNCTPSLVVSPPRPESAVDEDLDDPFVVPAAECGFLLPGDAG